MKIASMVSTGLIVCFASAGSALASEELTVLNAVTEKFQTSQEVTYWEDDIADEVVGRFDRLSPPQASIIERDCTNLFEALACVYFVSIFEKLEDKQGNTLGRIVAKYMVETSPGIIHSVSELNVNGTLKNEVSPVEMGPQVLQIALKEYDLSEWKINWEDDIGEEFADRNLDWDHMSRATAKVIERDCVADTSCVYLVSVYHTYNSASGAVMARVVGKYLVTLDAGAQSVREVSVMGSMN